MIMHRWRYAAQIATVAIRDTLIWWLPDTRVLYIWAEWSLLAHDMSARQTFNRQDNKGKKQTGLVIWIPGTLSSVRRRTRA